MFLRTIKVARDAVSGRFVSKATARRRPRTTVIETYEVLDYYKGPIPDRLRRLAKRRS